MKKKFTIALAICLSTLVFGCKKENNLEEVVALPEPEVPTTKRNIGNPAAVKTDPGKFKMVALPYGYADLEPYIDSKTMEIHYSKHHVAYTNNLNKAIVGTPLEQLSIEDILKSLDTKNAIVRNNAGGFYNHNLFWEIMAPNKGGLPKGTLLQAIIRDFGSFEVFKTQFTEAGIKQFGSGWAWLIVDKNGKLKVTQTANQDNPLMPDCTEKGTPILAMDVWEHAYYLKYQNKRADYIAAFFNVINWDKVAEKLANIQ